ncbi:MAG: hypothetical protein WCY05_05955, partial [Candidatus Omnitrophota bacterium]
DNPNIYWQVADRNREGKIDAMELFIDKDGDGKFTEGVDERITIFELARKYGFNTLSIFGDIINPELFPPEYLNSNSPMRFTVTFDLDEYLEIDYSKGETYKDLLTRWLEMVERNKANRYIVSWQLGNEKSFNLEGDFDETIKLFESYERSGEKEYKGISSEWLQAISYLRTIAWLIKATREKDTLSRPFIIGNHEAKEKYLKLMKYIFDKEDITDGVILGLNLYDGNDVDGIYARIKKHLGFPVFLKEFGCPAYILAELLKNYKNAAEPSKEELAKAEKEYNDSLDKLLQAKEDSDINAAKQKLEKAHQEFVDIQVHKAAALRAKADKNKNDAALQEEARIAAEEVQALWVENIAIKVFYNSHGLGNGNAVGFDVFRFIDGWYGANWWMDAFGNDPYVQDTAAEQTQDGKRIEVDDPARYFLEDWFGMFEIVAKAGGVRSRISAQRMKKLNSLIEQQMPTPASVEYKPVLPQLTDKIFEDILGERSRLAIIEAYKLLDNKDYKAAAKYIEGTYFGSEAAKEAVETAAKKFKEAQDKLLELKQKHADALRNKTNIEVAELELYFAEKAEKDADKELWKTTIKFYGLMMVMVEAIREDKRFAEQGIKPGELRNYWALDDAATIHYLYIQSLLQEGRMDEAFESATSLFKLYKNARIWIPAVQPQDYKFKSMQEILLEFKKDFSADKYKEIKDTFESKEEKTQKWENKNKSVDNGLKLIPDTEDDLAALLNRIQSGQFDQRVKTSRKIEWLPYSCGCNVWNVFARALGDWNRYAVWPIERAFGINSTEFNLAEPGKYSSSYGRMLWFYQNGNLGTGVIQILDATEGNALMSDAALRGVYSITLRKTGEEQGYQWSSYGFRGRRMTQGVVTYPIYEAIFEHEGQLKKLPSIWDLRQAIKHNDFSKAQPANVSVFKFKMNLKGEERLVVMLIDNITGEGETEILKIEQHPQSKGLKEYRDSLLDKFTGRQSHSAYFRNLAEIEGVVRELLDYDTRYTSTLVQNTEFVRKHPGLMFRVNTQRQLFFDVIEPGVVRAVAEVDKNNPHGAQIVRDVKTNLNDPEQRIAFLRAQITGDFSGLKSKDTGARALIDKERNQILILRYDETRKNKLIEGTILKLGNGLRLDSIFVGDVLNRIVFEEGKDRKAGVVTGEKDKKNFPVGNTYQPDIVRQMTEEQVIAWFNAGANPDNAAVYGEDRGVRRIYGFDHTPKDRKSEGRYEFEQIFIRYALNADGSLGKAIEGLHEFVSTKRRDLEPGFWFFGRRLREKTNAFQFNKGKFYVVNFTNNVGHEYEFGIEQNDWQAYIEAAKSREFPEGRKTGAIAVIGKLSDGRTYILMQNGEDHLFEVLSLKGHDELYIFKGKTDFGGAWKDNEPVIISGPEGVYYFKDTEALRKVLSEGSLGKPLVPNVTVEKGELKNGRKYLFINGIGEHKDDHLLEIFDPNVSRDKLKNIFKPVVLRGTWEDKDGAIVLSGLEGTYYYKNNEELRAALKAGDLGQPISTTEVTSNIYEINNQTFVYLSGTGDRKDDHMIKVIDANKKDPKNIFEPVIGQVAWEDIDSSVVLNL